MKKFIILFLVLMSFRLFSYYNNDYLIIRRAYHNPEIEKRALVATLNSIGLGLGSYLQGDYVSGTIALGLDVVSLSLITKSLIDLYTLSYDKYHYSNNEYFNANLTLYIGTGIMALSRLIFVIVPFFYKNNDYLKPQESLSFEPYFNLAFNSRQEGEFTFAFKKNL